MKRSPWYVEKGWVTDTEAYESSEVKVGDTEWQFSDGPVGQRSVSYDFIGRLDDALQSMVDDHGACHFVLGQGVSL